MRKLKLISWSGVTRYLFYSLPLIGIFYVPQLLRINQITCLDDQNRVCIETVNQKLSKLIGLKLFSSAIRTEALSTLVMPEYRLLSYQVVGPDRISIRVKPVDIAYFLKENDKLVGVTSEGVKVAITTDQKLLTVTTSSNQQPNLQVETDLHSDVMSLLTLLNQNVISAQSVDWQTNHHTVLMLSNGQKVIVDEDNLAANLARLSLVLKDPILSEKLPLYSSLDVRFRLPVLRK